MANTITINFEPCSPTTPGGYSVRYRLVGETDYIIAGPFTTSPIIIEAEGPPGAAYEGFLYSNCGGGKVGGDIPWEVGGGGSDDNSFVEPEFNYYLTAAFNFSIESVTGPAGLPPLPPTGTNGSQTGNHTGVTSGEGIFVVLTGSLVLTSRLIILVDNVQVACQQITGPDTYIFSGLTILSSQELRITINTGLC